MKIYIEGGGKTKSIKTELRKGFHKLLNPALDGKQLPRIVACGSRNDAFKDFKIAFKSKKGDEKVLLLVDSEDNIETSIHKWQHVENRDGWKKPKDANEDNIFFMVVCMESWFLSDINGLKKFFGKDFDDTKLPKNEIRENIDKQILYEGLKKATKNTTKGEYGKAKHSFKILNYLDTAKVKEHGGHSQDFFNYLKINLEQKNKFH